jgi:four helix bundle protein
VAQPFRAADKRSHESHRAKRTSEVVLGVGNYKLAIYRLCESKALREDAELHDQLRRAVAKPPAHISEAYGRFSPADSARILVQAKAELMESQNHLFDACDQNIITEAVRLEYHAMAQDVIGQVDGWRDYLQSEEARRNVEKIRERRKRNRNQKRNQNQNEKRNQNRESPE